MTIDTELRLFIEGLERAWPQPPLTLGVQAWRERAELLAAAARPPHPPGLAVRDHAIPGRGRDVRVRVYRPAAATPLPGLLYMHGGGWVVGSHDTHDAITAAFAARIPAVVLSVHYARAPEHPYPAAVDDCRAALDWLFDNAPALGIAPDAVFTAGDSAGGNLATVLALLTRGEAARRLRGQLLIYPCVDTDFSRPSYRSQAHAPYLKAEEMVWFWQQYCPGAEQRREPTAAPLHAPDLVGMPPALVAVAEHDPLHDEGVAYAQRLRDAGVPTELRPGIGLIHGHLRAGAVCRAAAREFDAMCDWVRRTAGRSA